MRSNTVKAASCITYELITLATALGEAKISAFFARLDIPLLKAFDTHGHSGANKVCLSRWHHFNNIMQSLPFPQTKYLSFA